MCPAAMLRCTVLCCPAQIRGKVQAALAGHLDGINFDYEEPLEVRGLELGAVGAVGGSAGVNGVPGAVVVEWGQRGRVSRGELAPGQRLCMATAAAWLRAASEPCPAFQVECRQAAGCHCV